MRFDTVVRNGMVVTATDTYASDIGIEGGRITAIAQALPIENARKVIDAAGRLVMPGGVDVHTHLDMPFGGTTSADDFESGTIAAAFGGNCNHASIDFAIQQKGQSLREAFETWMKKADRKAAIDYAFHCIITDLGDAQLEEMGELIHEGVSSFKLFLWPIPASSWWMMPLERYSMPRDVPGGEIRRPDLHARGKRRRDRRNRPPRPGRRQDGAEIPCAHTPHFGGSRGHRPRHRARGDGRRAGVHRASLLQRSAREGSRSTRPGIARLRRDLPAISLSLARANGSARIREREVCVHPTAARKMAPGEIVAGLGAGHAAGGIYRPLPVLLQGAERAGQGRLHHRRFPMAASPASSTG